MISLPLTARNIVLLCAGSLLACPLFVMAAPAVPSILLSTTSGPPTSVILVSGTRFATNVTVDIYFDTQDMAVAVTDGNGSFSHIPIQTMKTAQPGEHWVSAVERNDQKSAQKPFLVETDWTQSRYDAANSGLNLHENVLSRKSVRNLTLKWSDSNGTIDSIAAVSDGVVYLASQDSHLYALRASTGQVLWKYLDPAGSIASSPAVGGGVVYFGGFDGLHALDINTGQVLWQGPLQSVYGVTLNGDVVFFNSTDGYVHAVDAKTGSELWNYNSGASNLYSALAVADGVVYVASANLLALDATSGAFLWNYAIGNTGDIWCPPTVSLGVVYVGSTDKNFYAIDATSHSLRWSFATAGAITIASAIANHVVYVSSQDGNLYALDAASGSLLWKRASTSSSGTSAPALANGVLYVTQGQHNILALDADTGATLWQFSGAYYPSSPSVADGVLYVGDEGNFYAFSLTTGNSHHALTVRPDPSALRPDLQLRKKPR